MVVAPPSRAARALLWPVLCAGLLAACSKPAPAPEPLRSVRTMVVAEGRAGGTHEYAGEVRARVESRLGFRVGGKIVRRAVDLGDSVKAGALLAQLDPQDLRLSQDSARAALGSAQAQHDLAAADFKRYQELLAQGFISAAELERREATLKAARATLEQARAQVAVQGNQAAYASLVADASGVITAVEAEPGQVVAAGAPVVRLAHDGPRDVVFSVPEDQQAWVRSFEGKPGALKVRLWGADDVLPATVREVAAATDASTRTFLVKADIGRAPVKLGLTATAQIERPAADGVIKLPLAAVFESGGRSAVWVLDAQTMKVAAQPVQLAGADGNEVVIAAGLKPGAEVVTAGVHVLSPGQTVRRYLPAQTTAAR
ncbi:MAG TPA: efflux RND transporter periplasmic adaptor subunit [Methylibium sp.]|uniref:efflux RND transporter periplasmic adaptor subunit n=1 Tax=Methylibium sp. TaxID=2067992 RepID=UPI002DB9B170|nr:efflux RND transporter periplasmic adaptor subunit [Methylibium sp.]HEU4459032.1 efflux RND transporter periplasmic adaptor subunit [Methylibium sp.]